MTQPSTLPSSSFTLNGIGLIIDAGIEITRVKLVPSSWYDLPTNTSVNLSMREEV